MKKVLTVIMVFQIAVSAISAQKTITLHTPADSVLDVSVFEARAIDTRILGEWKRNGKNEYLIFESNHHMWFGTKDVPYVLQNAGNTLVINSISTYQRIGPSTASIVGHWRDDSGGEEIIYRADGRQVSLDDGEKVGYFGTYSVSAGTLSGFDYRSQFNTDSGNLVQYMHKTFLITTTPYTFTNGDMTLTIGSVGSAVVYTKQ
ncbi:MAG: hypothetical protein HKN33_18000 [Pyrinomonadaceae bacterium]|nr:hypothetical protein [Pyrinomonadaceae bacterium]